MIIFKVNYLWSQSVGQEVEGKYRLQVGERWVRKGNKQNLTFSKRLNCEELLRIV